MLRARQLLLSCLIAFGSDLAWAQIPDPSVPGNSWETLRPDEAGLEKGQLEAARDYALTGGGSGMITRHGFLVMAWGDMDQSYDLKSTTKSIGVTALGLALKDGKAALDDLAIRHEPAIGVPPESNRATGWIPKITLRHLATQTAGFEKPGGYTRLLFEPGTKWDYSDSGPNWLADCLTRIYREDMRDLLFRRVFTEIGIRPDDLRWRSNAYRPHDLGGVPRREFGSGIHANVDAMARIGYLYLRGGRWKDRQLIPRDFVDLARSIVPSVVGLPEHAPEQHGNASDHYGYLWWNNADGTLAGVPRDAFWSWGLYDSLILVVPSLDMVVSRAGRSWERKWSGHYDVLAPFIEPLIVAAGRDPSAIPPVARPVESARDTASGVEGKIHLRWAPASDIVRKASGSDNWPLTWADDDALYAAYGDGNGFEPFTPEKLSLGFAKVTGNPSNFQGGNVRSVNGERIGDGSRGGKASGLLMVNGTLYMWVRNVQNSQLEWSNDRAKTWNRAAWRFTESFGAPTFLNFGRDYEGAVDSYVYVYSFDSSSAYKPADRMVLARVAAPLITDRSAYEFFVHAEGGAAVWSREIADRGAVFTDPGNCYRSGITYNAGLRQFVWAQVKGGNDTRFEGGLGVYMSSQPWGPWRTVFLAEKWDVGPGESASFPTKWMSQDGRVMHLVFSGNDAFSVRRADVIGELP